jgi:hypothetical protein
MTEPQNNNAQGNTQGETESGGGESSAGERTTHRDFDKANAPEYRLDELNRKRKAAEDRAKTAEQRLQQLERSQQEQEENRAQAQGEYQQLAEKRQKKIDTLNQEVQSLKSQMVRDRRYRAWVAGASGSIKPAAIGDAFDMITEDEWATVNEDDENSVRMLAQNLAERKEYLSAGPIGAGSGGSKRPVMGLGSNNNSNNKDGVKIGATGSRPTMHFKKQRPSWK